MSKYHKLKRKILSSLPSQTQCDQNATININIQDANDIISSYAEDNQEVINSEFANFLDNSVKDVSPKCDLTLQISATNCNADKISTAIKNYYFNEFRDTQRKLRNNLIFSICTLIIGLLALALTITLHTLDIPLLLGGAVDIFAWVFVWESFDLFFFRRAELKYQQYRQINFINSKIILK